MKTCKVCKEPTASYTVNETGVCLSCRINAILAGTNKPEPRPEEIENFYNEHGEIVARAKVPKDEFDSMELEPHDINDTCFGGNWKPLTPAERQGMLEYAERESMRAYLGRWEELTVDDVKFLIACGIEID